MLLPRLLFLVSLTCYADAATNYLPRTNISNSETKAFSDKLWKADINRATDKEVRINMQSLIDYSGDNSDKAPEKLFSYVDPEFLKKETFKKLIALLEKYDIPYLSVAETTTEEKEAAIDSFLDSILDTQVFKLTYEYLHKKGHPYAESTKVFKKWVRQLWFGGYSRSSYAQRNNISDTSAFEHVFVGEINKRSVSGMHNWVRYYQLENDSTERINFLGTLSSTQDYLVTLRYRWRQNILKKVGGFLVKTSPEFEMALYTFCFLARRAKTCYVKINGCNVAIVAHAWTQNEKIFVQTMYPKTDETSDVCWSFEKS